MKTITIKVTTKDIRLGKRGKSRNCPVARACRTAGIVNPRIMNTYMFFTGADSVTKHINLSAKARAFIQKFDDRARGAPLPKAFKFKLPLNTWRLKQI